MQSCLPSADPAIESGEFPVSGTPAGTLAARSADLRVHGKTVTVAGKTPATGEQAVFFRPVLSAPAFARRDGTVLADAWLPDLARLGELEAHLGDGVIEGLVADAAAAGRLPKRTRRRIMSFPLVIRLMIAMTLAPDASYCEALSRLAGLLADVPFTRDWHVPTEKVVTDWRLPVPPSLVEALFWRAAGPLVADGSPSAATLAGRPLAGADGMLVNVADTKENRAFFGTTGTADGTSSFPQVRIVALIARAGRAMLGAILGQTSAGEQTLLKRLAKRRPELFDGLVVCFDRNFRAPRGALPYRPRSGHRLEEVSVGLMAYLDP